MATKTTRALPLEEVLANAGYDDFNAMAEAVISSDAHCPTLCEESCEVEPDGICPHGHKSLLRLAGMI